MKATLQRSLSRYPHPPTREGFSLRRPEACSFWLPRIAALATAFILGLPGLIGVAAAGPFSTTEIGKYLIIGTKRAAEGDAVNVNSSNELGADQQFLSTADPNTAGVFGTRWSSTTNRTIGPVPPSAPVFEGIDWSGNVAVTSPTGKFSMSDIDVYAALGVRCATTPCDQSVSNTLWFPDQQLVGQPMPANGVFPFNSQPLVNELIAARIAIAGLIPESFLFADLENGSSALDLDAIDANNDGLAVIDIIRGGSDFKLNNFDLILNGSGNVVGIFRIRGNSNMLIDNSSITLGPGGIGGGSATVAPSNLGALFVQYEEPVGNSDQVIKGNNVILNGIGLWDLNPFRAGGYDDSVKTELNINDGQGCAQFISGAVIFNDVRWNRCAGQNGNGKIPLPATLLLLVSGLGVGLALRARGKFRASAPTQST